MRLRLIALAFSGILVSPCWGDVVHMKDGRKIEGKVTDLGDRIKVERRIGSILLDKKDVLRVEVKEFTEAPVVAPPQAPPAAPATPVKLPESSPPPLAAARPRPIVRLVGSYATVDGNFALHVPAAWSKVPGSSALKGPEDGQRIDILRSESAAELPEIAESTKKILLKDAPPGAACTGWEYFLLAGRPAVQLEFESTFELKKSRTLVQIAKNDKTIVTLTFAADGKSFDRLWYEAHRIMRSMRFFAPKGEFTVAQKRLFADAWERGEMGLRAAQGETAVRAFRECVEIVPDLIAGHSALIRGFILQKEYRNAVVAAQLALRIEPDNPLLSWLLALSYLLWGKGDDAAQALKKAMAVDPENDEAFFHSGLLHAEKGKWGEARDAWRKGVECNPSSGRLRYALGFAWEKLGQRREAAEAFEKCLEPDPGVTEAKERLAALKK